MGERRISRKAFLKGMLAAGAAGALSLPAPAAAAAARPPAVGDPDYGARVAALFARAQVRRP